MEKTKWIQHDQCTTMLRQPQDNWLYGLVRDNWFFNLSAVDRQMRGTIHVIGRRSTNSELVVARLRLFLARRRMIRGEVGVSTPPLCHRVRFSGQYLFDDEKATSLHEVDLKWAVEEWKLSQGRHGELDAPISSYWHHLSEVVHASRGRSHSRNISCIRSRSCSRCTSVRSSGPSLGGCRRVKCGSKKPVAFCMCRSCLNSASE